MCKPGHSLASASDSPGSQTDPDLPVPSKMNGHLVVDIITLCFVVVVAFLYLVFRSWQKRKAAAAAREAEKAAAAAAALAFHSEATQTDVPLFFGLDDAVNRLHQQLTSHQHRLDSMEAQRLEWVNFNRLVSLLPFPRPNLPKMDENHQDLADQLDGSGDVLGNVNENWSKYPPV